MLRVILTVYTVFFGLCIGEDYEEMCWGEHFRIPFDDTPPWHSGSVYFTPSNGGPEKTLMVEGKAMEPRLSVIGASLFLRGLTEEDDGYFSNTPYTGQKRESIFRLRVLSCNDMVIMDYGDTYDHFVPPQVDFVEYTAFHSLNQPEILWNRSNPEVNASRQVEVTENILRIPSLTQKDNGYFNFREKSNRVAHRLHLIVEEVTRNLRSKAGDDLLIQYPWPSDTWDVTFTPEGVSDNVTVIKGGRIVKDEWFEGRVSVTTEDIEIISVKNEDFGAFHFMDPEGNEAMRVNLVVEKDYLSLIFIVVPAVIVPLVLICCCCCCCKKKQSKKNAAVHLIQYQPTDLSYATAPSSSAFSYQPVNASSLNLQVTPPSTNNPLDGVPKFQLKGPMFASVLPLNSDSTSCAVYTSDKLNFC